MDIWIAIHPDNAAKLVVAIRKFGLNTPMLETKLFLQKDSVARMGSPPMRIEVIT